jgi:hypothetical protein
MFNHAPMYCNSSYSYLTNVQMGFHIIKTNSYENINIGIILKDIYERFNHNTHVSYETKG